MTAIDGQTVSLEAVENSESLQGKIARAERLANELSGLLADIKRDVF